MKQFIKQIISFFILCTAVFVILFFVFNKADNQLVKCGNTKATYIFGNSHAMSSMDPEILQEVTGTPFTSYGSNGQSLFWAVQGMEKRITQCPGSIILIEFTNNSLTTDWWTYDNSRMLRERDKLYQLDASDWTHLFAHNPFKTSKLMLTLPFPSTKIEGKFGINDKTRLEEDLKDKGARIMVQYQDMESTQDRNMGYEELKELIRTYPSTAFIIVRSPMHHAYFKMLEKVNNEGLYNTMLKDLATIPNCKTYDFGHLELNDSCFADLDHLNYKGAKIFSGILADTLSKTALNK